MPHTAPSNSEIAEILYEIGEYLTMQNEPFRPRAYEKAAETIEALEEGIGEIYKRGGLKAIEEIPGVGQSIAGKIEEILKTGHLKYFDQLKKKTPVDLEALSKIEGLGPKKILALYKKLKIKNIAGLEKATLKGSIAKLAGFGKRSEENIKKGIEFLKTSGNRFLLGFILPQVEEIKEKIGKLKEVERIDIAGSIRRRKETIGDTDILIISEKPKPVMDYFVSMPGVAQVIAHGETKSAVKMRSGLHIDLRVVPKKSYGAALGYFTGSKDHNIALREIAVKHGWKLNEYGLFKGAKQIAGRTEEELYEKLGLTYIEPEMRENTGEIALARAKKVSTPIGYGDLHGDLQTQTKWSDGANSIEEMAYAAIKRGLAYIVVTDHTKRLAMTHGLDEKRIRKQGEEIDELNRKLHAAGHKFKILKGTEVDILKDGSLDLPDDALAGLDVVGASIHSYFNLPRAEQTKRMIRAMENKHVDIIFHPTGRIIQKRPAYNIDMEQIIKVAKQTGTVLEIDGSPERLDLKDEYIRMCVDAGVKMSVDSDAHSDLGFAFLEYGLAQARRGWAKKSDIINAWPVEKMLKMLK